MGQRNKKRKRGFKNSVARFRDTLGPPVPPPRLSTVTTWRTLGISRNSASCVPTCPVDPSKL